MTLRNKLRYSSDVCSDIRRALQLAEYALLKDQQSTMSYADFLYDEVANPFLDISDVLEWKLNEFTL